MFTEGCAICSLSFSQENEAAIFTVNENQDRADRGDGMGTPEYRPGSPGVL